MSTVTELNPRLAAVTEAGVSAWRETLRSHGLAAERVELEGDPAAAVRTLTARITAILEGS
jgi:hypothetical protein